MRFISALAGALCLLAGLSACAPTTSGGLQSAFSPIPAGPDFAPRQPSRPDLSGYIAEGPGFMVEMLFDEAPDGRVEIDTIIDTGAAALLMPRLTMAEPWLADGVQRYEGRLDRHGEIVLRLEAGPCAVGDIRYGLFAGLQVGGRTYEGCARETGPHVRWTHEIGEFLPAIEACRADSAVSSLAHVRGAGNRRVSVAYRQASAVIVRYDYPGNGRFDCTYSEGAVRWRAVSDLEPALPGEGDPYFLPGRMPEAGDGCFLYERVRNADGHVVGALAHDGCTVTPVG